MIQFLRFIVFVHTDAPGANVSQDAGILVLTILISSTLIYNSQNVPYKNDLEKLQYAIIFACNFVVLSVYTLATNLTVSPRLFTRNIKVLFIQLFTCTSFHADLRYCMW